ncbi:hypothetical protein PPL_02743 [Heterostelium album PN500]|uniref:Uncharacterized protein n=1 Tax=Heterostelium pallidum (strain ATCC 26659 / Pp 5 / PN500) TaxID=670386 RepID=D3B2X9_HETP5|nr:hypothetical protein PPL_02743 [Heterostelium album PN500]EFA83677.1 hypothetical protein PPL_02743 [Heterostelium album PN500]|eukprot:XP_020435794.1 hypothetical protein PPL_02743 [Heterostelium album PN500]
MTKEILEHKVYNRDELEKMKRDVLVEIMKEYSFKTRWLKKRYADRCDHSTSGASRRSEIKNYRWLLSIGLVSKELFKLISSLFTRVDLYNRDALYNGEVDPTMNVHSAQSLKNCILNPRSVFKNIIHLTLSMETFKNLTDKTTTTTCTPVELRLIFNSVRKFKVIDTQREKPFQIQHCKLLIQYMPNLKSLILDQAKIDNIKVFQILQQIPRLTSLDISNIRWGRFPSKEHIIGNSMRKLKLPMYFSRMCSNMPSENTQLETLSLGSVEQKDMIYLKDQLKYLNKLIVWYVQHELGLSLSKLLCLAECRVRTLYATETGWITQMLRTNRTIVTLDVGDDLSSTVRMASNSPSINRIIYHSNSTMHNLAMNTKTDRNKSSGYAHIKSKNRPLSNHAQLPIWNYAKKIYDATDNHTENQTIEESFPNLKFLYYRHFSHG